MSDHEHNCNPLGRVIGGRNCPVCNDPEKQKEYHQKQVERFIAALPEIKDDDEA